jgi:uncharacterized protein (TIRG00374 family)
VKKSLGWAFVVSAIFLVPIYLLTDWQQLLHILRHVSIDYLLAAFFVLFVANVVRAIRFRLLDHTRQRLLFWWLVNQVYNLMTATLPGGAGEAATVLVLKRLSSYSLPGGIRVLLVTRLMDLAWFCVMLLLSLLFVSSVVTYVTPVVVLAGALLALTIILLLPVTEQYVLRFSKRLLPSSFRVSEKIRDSLENLHHIARQQREEGRHAKAMGQSAVVVFGSALSAHLTFLAFGVDFTWSQTLYCYGVYALFQLVPVQGIAGIGTQAAWWALALNAAGHLSDDYTALGILLYGTFFLFIALMGFTAWVVFLYLSAKKSQRLRNPNTTSIHSDRS